MPTPAEIHATTRSKTGKGKSERTIDNPFV